MVLILESSFVVFTVYNVLVLPFLIRATHLWEVIVVIFPSIAVTRTITLD